MLSACIVVNVVLLKLAVGDSLKTNGVAFASSQKKFAICMLTKDDNHYWPEFLAYHMTFLPLQRMIVVIDPTSRTSPLPIFDRFAPYINITVVNDTQLGLHQMKPVDDIATHRRRQKYQIEDCTMRLRKEGWQGWVAYIDSDEFIVPNWYALRNHSIQKYTPGDTLSDILHNNPHMRRSAPFNNESCISMHRTQVGIQESSIEKQQKDVPSWLNATNFFTLRYRYPKARYYIPSKSIIDFEVLAHEEIKYENCSGPHVPIKRLCSSKKESVWTTQKRHGLMVYHYPGTLESFLYARNDTRRNEKDYLWNFAQGNPKDYYEDDSARFWVKDFVNRFGEHKAKELLEGAGLVTLLDQ